MKISDVPNSEARFDDQFRLKLTELLEMRRDVRHFCPDPLPDGMVAKLIRLACLAPSVGYSQPWRWVRIDAPWRRTAIVENFRECNAEALNEFVGEQAALYARLKLAGLIEAPVHLAVFIDPGSRTGHGLGIRTMPEMLSYSAVCAVNTLWLAARAEGVGVGWVSILDPAEVKRTLDVPLDWQFIAYLCVGYPQKERDRPELESEGWERHQPCSGNLIER